VLDPSFLNAVNADVLPASDNTYDLGSSTYRWRNLYLAGSLNLSGTLNVGSLQVGGTTVIDSNRVLQNISSVAQSLVPSADNSYDLGSSSYRWRSIYAVGVYGALVSLD
jgi:hypothetical protein